MKSLHNIAVNYCKTLKANENDENTEAVYAEVNIILSEPKYTASDNGLAKRTIDISEIEFGLSKEGAKRLIAIIKEIHANLVRLEKNDKGN